MLRYTSHKTICYTWGLCKMSIKTDIVEAPSHWNCYLLYGDCSGMDDAEIAACDKYFAGMQVLDCNTDTATFYLAG